MSKKENEIKQSTDVSQDVDEDVVISPRTGKPIDKRHSPKKPRKNNSWLSPQNYLQNLEPGDNTTLIQINAKLFAMPEIDMNDPRQVSERLGEYFKLYAEADLKPTVAGMAIALNGMSTNQLRCIVVNRATGGVGYKPAIAKPVAVLIKKAYATLENLWESYMNSGKINPVSGIFLGKNNYGYQDKTEYVVTPNQGDTNDYSAEDIKKRYLSGEEQKRLSTTDTKAEPL